MSFLSYELFNGAVRRVNNDLLGKLLFPEKYSFKPSTTKNQDLGILVVNLGFCPLIHSICCEIIKYLNDVEYSQTLDWYDEQKFGHFVRRSDYPSRSQLFLLALKIQGNLDSDNFDKFIY